MRGTHRPEFTSIYTFNIPLDPEQRNRQLARNMKRPVTLKDAFFAMMNAGRKTVVTINETAVTGRIISVRETTIQVGEKRQATRVLEVQFRQVVTA